MFVYRYNSHRTGCNKIQLKIGLTKTFKRVVKDCKFQKIKHMKSDFMSDLGTSKAII